MQKRSLLVRRLDSLRRLAILMGVTFVSGAAMSVTLCWFGAWDLSIPAAPPGGLIGRGPSFDEPMLLRWNRRVIPRWAAAQWAYDQERFVALESSSDGPPDGTESSGDGARAL